MSLTTILRAVVHYRDAEDKKNHDEEAAYERTSDEENQNEEEDYRLNEMHDRPTEGLSHQRPLIGPSTTSTALPPPEQVHLRRGRSRTM